MSIGRKEDGWLVQLHALSWIKNTFAPAVDKKSENVLFLDNLSCQMTDGFHSTCSELAPTVVYLSPPCETDKCQPVDQGEGVSKTKTSKAKTPEYFSEESFVFIFFLTVHLSCKCGMSKQC